jgi:hypothetical protein
MYFAVLRGKQYDIQAVREVAPALVAAANVTPVIEPVRNEWARINEVLDAGLTVGLIVNPANGIYSPPGPRATRVRLLFPAPARTTFARTEVLPTLLVTDTTTAATVRRFHASLSAGRPHLVFVASSPRDATAMPLVHATPPQHLLIARRAVPASTLRARNVDVTDSYVRQPRNAAYPFDELFTDRPATIGADASYAHFGDYSIVGATYSDGGGQAANVALHLVYSTGGPGTALRIRHYVSSPHPNLATMCREALDMMVADLPMILAMTPINQTSTVREMVAVHASGGHYSLAKGKEMAIRHHLQLMTVAQ